MWIVMCRVSGGVTGTRESVLKGRDGLQKHFETEAEATAEAVRLMATNQGDRYRTADFRYWAERYDYR
jgi:hypothetical protein